MNFSRQFFDIKKNYAIVAWFGRAYLMSMDEDGNQCHKPIEDVKVGDKVLAYDEETGEQAYKPVKQLFRNTTEKWCTVSVLVGDVITEIVSTPGHKYYLPENTLNREVGEKQEHASYIGLSEKWVSAHNLRKGDKVLLSDGSYGIIETVKIEELANPETTYNFEVEDFHTYYVENGVLVHNKACGVGGHGWEGDATWRANVKRVSQGGDILELKGGIPTQAQAEKLIAQAKGTILRIETAHPLPNPHNYPHINYLTRYGTKGTLKIINVIKKFP